MIFYGIVIVAAIVIVTWFVRTPLFRQHRRGGGKDPGQAGSRGVGSGSSYNASREFRKND
jgi:hypothetical protein